MRIAVHAALQIHLRSKKLTRYAFAPRLRGRLHRVTRFGVYASARRGLELDMSVDDNHSREPLYP